jgi:hypothetical protein
MIDFAVGSGDYYDDVGEFLRDDPTIETDITIIGMSKRLRIRALSFAQMERVNKLATNSEGTIDNTEFVLHTIVEGVVRPKMNYAQVQALVNAHGETVKTLAENIWQIGKISKGTFQQYIQSVQELKTVSDAEKQ